jgi:SulP family sulfate permease
MGIARLGALVNFISHSVIVGFTAGAAVLIAASQLKNFFGVDMPQGLHLMEKFLYFAEHIGDVHPYATAVGLATLIAGIYVRRRMPRIPYMIAAMLAGSLASVLISHFLYVGGPAPGIKVVGALPATLPPLSSPDLNFNMIKELAPVALAVTLFALTEAISISRSLAARSGDLVDGNQEFIGQGLSNIFGSFFSSYVATGSFNRSGVNFEAGARTPLAAVFAGLLLMGIVVFVAPLLAYLPNAAMAGILFLVAFGIIDFAHIRTIVRASRSDSLVLWGTFLATLFLQLDFAIMLGVFLSLAIYLHRASRPRVRVRVPDPRLPRQRFSTDPSLPECPQFKLVRIDGPVFFGAVNYRGELRGGTAPHHRQAQRRAEAPAHHVPHHQLHRRRRCRNAGAGGAPAQGGRRAALLPPAAGERPRAARAGRVSKGRRRGEPVRYQGRSHRRDLSTPRSRYLRALR